MLFGMTQNDVNQSFEDIRERAGAIQTVLRVQRNELRDMDVLDWQGKMLDWRPMLMWGMLLDPFDWYARGMEGMGLSSKALRAGFEHFGIVELSGADAVRNISRGVQGLPPVRSPGDASGIVTMHGGLGWNLFTNPEALYPEMRQSADDILEMIASGADLDNSEAIGARARIAQTMINVRPRGSGAGRRRRCGAVGGGDEKSVAQLVAEGQSGVWCGDRPAQRGGYRGPDRPERAGLQGLAGAQGAAAAAAQGLWHAGGHAGRRRARR